jgi:HAE1 family hydrophobic/amphiphilic exporter-1
MSLSVVLVFLLMGVLFESFILPVAVLFSIPSAVLGSLVLLLILNQPLDMMGCVGGLVLVGIVVNNAIVLMDAIGRLRRRGLQRIEACLRGGQARLRPIWMTALSTVFGLAPMLFADPRSGGASWRTLSMVIAGGLLASTLFTLLAVPLFYTIFDDLSRSLGKAWQWAVQGRRRRVNDGPLSPAAVRD